MTLANFWDKLNSHDWYYHFSDDHRHWTAGVSGEKALKLMCQESPEHQALYDAFSNHYFSGEPWKTPKAPKPDRPEE